MYYMKKKVSIVVPLYKSEKYLNALVDSILNQSYTNIELILVDDESPDKCGMICDQYAKKDTRVKVIHKKNGGCCDARNKGLELVTGDYLMFADGDDWMELDCVEYLVDLMEKNNCQMSMTDSVFTTFDTKQNPIDNIKICSNEEACCMILYADIPIGPWNKLYMTSIVKDRNLSFSVPWFGEGLYFSCMASQYADKVAVGHKRIYNYRLDNPNSGTTLKNVQHAKNAYRNIHFIKDTLVVRTENTIRAANWHIFNNAFMALSYIYNSAAPNKYKDFSKTCVREYRNYLMKVLKDPHDSVKKKLFYILTALSPITYLKLCRLKLNLSK